MKWGDLGGFCGFLDSGPPGGPLLGPLWGPPLPGRATKIEKVAFIPGAISILGGRKSLLEASLAKFSQN